MQDQTSWASLCQKQSMQGPGEGDAQHSPCPSEQKGQCREGQAVSLTGSPLLPRAPAGPSTTTVSPCTQRLGGVYEEGGTVLLPSLPVGPAPGTHLVSFGPWGPSISLRGRRNGETLQGCTAGSRKHLSEHPIPRDSSLWGCIIHPPWISSLQGPLPCPHAPHGSQASPVGDKSGGQGGVWLGVQLRVGATYSWSSLSFSSWAPIFTLQERVVRKESGMGAPAVSPYPGDRQGAGSLCP